MKKFDENIRANPDILYYARYVDDIVAVFTPNPSIDTEDYRGLITKELEKLELDINDEKTVSFDLKEPASKKMYYLGYDFSFGNSEVKLSPSKKRINRYKERLRLTFASYHKEKNINEKHARKLLVKRLRFLTGNTRLRNNKRNALVGVYFSNSLANDLSKLIGLDAYLQHLIDGLNGPSWLSRITQFSFKTGYEKRPFSIYTQDDLKSIVSVWKK